MISPVLLSRPLNDVVREAQASGATFAAIDKLSKAWIDKACLMRFPEVWCGGKPRHTPLDTAL